METTKMRMRAIAIWNKVSRYGHEVTPEERELAIEAYDRELLPKGCATFCPYQWVEDGCPQLGV